MSIYNLHYRYYLSAAKHADWLPNEDSRVSSTNQTQPELKHRPQRVCSGKLDIFVLHFVQS